MKVLSLTEPYAALIKERKKKNRKTSSRRNIKYFK